MNHDGSPDNPWGGDWSSDSPEQTSESSPPHEQTPQGQPPPPHGQAQSHGQPHYGQPHRPQSESASGLAIATLITGLLTWCFTPVGLVALILAYIEWNNIQNGESSEKGKVFVLVGGGVAAFALLLTCAFAGFYVLLLSTA